MSCPVCGQLALPDSETGFEADTVCPDCRQLGWDDGPDGTVIEPPDRIHLAEDDIEPEHVTAESIQRIETLTSLTFQAEEPDEPERVR